MSILTEVDVVASSRWTDIDVRQCPGRIPCPGSSSRSTSTTWMKRSASTAKLFGTEPAKRPPRLCQLRDRRAAAQAGPAGEPGPGRQPQPPRRRGRRHRHGRRRAGPARRGRAGLGRRAGHHLLLRPAGQVLGPGRPNGERWEIYTVLEDSPTFWGEDGGQSWQTVEATLDAGQAGQAPQCCGGQQASYPSQAGACCT